MRAWKHQTKTLVSIQQAVADGVRRMLVVLPTGAGKTFVLARVALEAYRTGRHVLIMTHRYEILEQLVAAIVEAGVPAKAVGVIRASDKRAEASAPVQVASVDTLRRRALPKADLVMVDEAHRAAAESYVQIADAYPDAIHIGFTATPCRLDGKPLGDVYDHLIVEANYSDLIAAGIIMAVRVYSVPRSRVDVSKVSVTKGDFDGKEIAALMNQGVLIGSIVKEWKVRAGGRLTVCFASGIEHGHSIVRRFRRAGVRAAMLTGEHSPTERAALLKDFGEGKIRVLVNYDLLREGWDMPECKCVILARPTKSLTVYNQQVGRILRRGEQPIVLDHAGNVYRFGFPDRDRTWSLTEVVKVSKTGDAPVRECPECGLVSTANATVCAECGHEWPRKEREQKEDTRLVEIDREAFRREAEARVRPIAEKNGYPESWVQRVVQAQIEVVSLCREQSTSAARRSGGGRLSTVPEGRPAACCGCASALVEHGANSLLAP